MQRRKEYKLNDPKFKVYHKMIDRLLDESIILNSGKQQPMNAAYVIMDKQNMNWLLEEKKDEGGSMDRLRKKLIAIEDSFAVYQELAQNQGKPIPEEMPQYMLNSKLEIIAKLDILHAECQELTKRIEAYKEPQIKEDNSKVLKFGLKEHAVLRNNIVVEIDGQKTGFVEVDGENILIINDNRSKYLGMCLLQYREMAKKWREERRKHDQEKLKKMQEHARSIGADVPSQYTTPTKSVSQKNLPDFPNWAVNYLQQVEKEIKV